MIKLLRTLTLSLVVVGLVPCLARAEPAAPTDSGADPVLARTAGFEVRESEFIGALSVAARERFYHGKPPEDEFRKLQQEVILSLVDRRLLLDESVRRGVNFDEARIAAQIGAYETRYAASPQWPAIKQNALPALTAKLQDDSRLARLEETIRAEVAAPGEDELQRYYDANLDKFTEPEKVRLSVLLLSVHPSSPAPVWEKADNDAQLLMADLKAGKQDFLAAVAARSGHQTAANGGDLGLSHRGRLPGGVEEIINDYQVGDLIGPIRLLEGAAIFKLTERILPKRYALVDVRQRATDLWLRDQRELAWKQFKETVRAAAKLEVDAVRFPGLNPQGTAGAGR